MAIIATFMIINLALWVAVLALIDSVKDEIKELKAAPVTLSDEEPDKEYVDISAGEAQFLASLSEMMTFTGELPKKGVRDGD